MAETATSHSVTRTIRAVQLPWLYLTTFTMLPVLAGFAVSSGPFSPLALAGFAVVSIVMCAAPVALFGRYRLAAACIALIGAGAWLSFYVLYRYHGIPSTLMFDVLATSGLREAWEYVAAHRLATPCMLLVFGLVVAVACAWRVGNGRFSTAARKRVLAANLLVIALSLLWQHLPVTATLDRFPSPLSEAAAAETYPVNLALLAVEGMRRLGAGPAETRPFHAIRAHPPGGPEVHILIIGESARFDRWHVNGYARDTSPELDRLAASGELISFTKAHAGANFTVLSVPIILSGIVPEEFQGVVNRNLVGLMKELGFMTAWIANQDPGIAYAAGVMTSDYNVQMYDDRGRSAGFTPPTHEPYDEELLPPLERALAFQIAKKFIVLHGKGNHMEYKERYPPRFARYSSQKDGLYREQPHRDVIDAYDNSIAYTDWIIGQVIERARALPGSVTVTYISDHGEALYESASDGYFGHGSHVGYRAEQHIPFFIWANAEFRSNHPDKWRALLSNRDKVVGQENVLHTFADMIDAEYPGQRRALSLAQPSYTPRATTRFIANSHLAPLLVN